MANIERIPSAVSGSPANIADNGRVQEIQRQCQLMIRRLNEVASTPSHPSMFKVYNGSERYGRLRAVTKDLIDSGTAAVIEYQSTQRCPETTLSRIIKLLHSLGEEFGQFSPADGKWYMNKMCERCSLFIKEFGAALITSLTSAPGPRLIDTARLIEACPGSTLQLATETWEVWAAQGKESIVEIQRIADGIFEDTFGDSDEQTEDPKPVSPVERSIASKVFLLCRLVKTMVRKIRLRCIQPIFEPIESFDEIQWLDELMEAGESLFPAIDEIATAVIPAQIPSHICSEAVNLVRVAQKVCELGWQQAGQEEHQKWFVNCHAQLDSLLIPILESNPSR